MSLISKKDIGMLMEAGFSEEDLGLIDGGQCGVQVYETPDDYFAHELVDNAKEAGEVDLYDEASVPDDIKKERYDDSHPGIYDDQEYAGNDDWLEDVDVNLRGQAMFLRKIKLGRISVWQRRNKKGVYEWRVENLKVEIPEDDRARFSRLTKDDQKELWKAYARGEWKRLWSFVAMSLREYEIEEKITFTAKNGTELNILVVDADNLREMGYKNLPAEARWITMVYFEKDE